MVSMGRGRALLFLDRFLATTRGMVRQFPINAETFRERLNMCKRELQAQAE